MSLEHCLFLSTETFDPISAIIRWEETAAWSHCGWLRLSDNWTFSAEMGGIAWRPPNPKAKILKLSCDGMEASLSKALLMAGHGYDFLGIIGIALGQNWEQKGTDFCAQLLFWYQNEVRCPLVNHKFIPFEHLKPSYILLSPYVQEIK